MRPIAPVPMVTHRNWIEPGRGLVNGPARTRLGKIAESLACGLVLVAMAAMVAAQAAASVVTESAGGGAGLLTAPMGGGALGSAGTTFGFFTGSFTKAAVTGNQDFTLPTGCPDLTAAAAGTWAIQFWTAGQTAAAGTWGAMGFGSLGFTTGAANSFATGMWSTDAGASSVTARRTAAKCLTAPTTVGTGVQWEADFVSFPTSTTGRINWTTNAGGAEVIMFTVYTGVSAKAVTWTTPVTAVSKSVTGAGFKPDLVLHASGLVNGVLPASLTNSYFGFGAMNKHGQQWGNSVASQTGVNPANTGRFQQTDAAIALADNDGATIDEQAHFVSMDADGFTVNFSTALATAYNMISLCLSGVSSKLGAFTMTTSVASQTVTTRHGFAARGALFSNITAGALGAPGTTASWALGMWDGTNARHVALSDVDVVTPIRAKSIWRNDAPVVVDFDSATSAKATVTTTTADFTLSYSTQATGAYEVLYLLLGDPGTNTTPQTIDGGNANLPITSTSYSNQKHAVTLSTGRMVFAEGAGTGTSVNFIWSDDGVTWTTYTAGTSSILGWVNGSIAAYVDSGGVERLVAVWEQSGVGGGRTSGDVYVMVGTFNAGRTTLTWGTAIAFGSTSYGVPDISVHAQGTGGMAHAACSFLSGSDNRAYHFRYSIDSAGVLTFITATRLDAFVSFAALDTFPSIDIDSNSSSASRIHVTYSAGATGAGKGIRYRTATLAAGVPTFAAEVEVDNTKRVNDAARYVKAMWDGTRIVLAAVLDDATQSYLMLYESTNFTTFTTRTLATYTDTGTNWPFVYAGSAAVDLTTGDVYFIGTAYTGTAFVGWYSMKWTRATTTLGAATLLDETPPNSAIQNAYAWFSGSTVRWVYTAGNNVPYAVKYDAQTLASAPNAPTLTSPASGAYVDVSGGVTFSATYNSTDGANQNAYALRAKRAGGSYVYWNAGSGLWQGTIVWNAVVTTPGSTWNVTVPASATIANGATLNWSAASQEATASLQGAFATDSVITMQAVPVLTVTAPSGTVTGTVTPTVTWTTTPAAGAVQTTYRLVIYTPAQYGAGGFVAGTTAGYFDTGVVGSSNQSYIVSSGANLQTGVAYRFYVQVTETGGESSTWQFSSATFTVNPPADPTIVATPGTDGTTLAPRTAVTVQGRDNLLTAEQASLEAGTAAGWAAGANSVIGATGFANLLTAEESSFEGGTTVGWTPTGATAANSTVQAAQGTHSMTLTATGANVISASTPTGVSGFAVTPLQEYTALASFRTVVTARAMSVKINWYQASGAASAVRASDTGTAVTDATGSWVQGFVSAVAPSDAVFAAIVVQSNVAVVLSEVHYVDAISLAQGFDLRWALGGTTPTVLAVDGQHSLAIAALAGANPASASTPTGTSGFAVTALQQITALASFRAAATPRTCQLQVLWYQASGAASGVRASDTSAGTADSTSAWTQVSLTVTAPSDAAFAAVVLLVTGALATGEEHFVDAIDYGPGSSTVWTRGGLSGLTTALVQFSDDGVTWTTMRTSGSTFPFPTQALTFLDYEAPPGAVRSYRAQVQASVGGGATILSNFASTTATGTTPSQWVISDPTDPTSAVLCHAQGNPSRQLVGKLTMHSPFGRSRQVKVSDGVKGWAGRLTVRTLSTAQEVRLESLLARDTTLLIQSPEGGGRQWYANVDADPALTQNAATLGSNVLGGVAGRGTVKMPHTDLTLSYAEAERP